ncbi:MAG TPA: hypothetical protein PK599_05905 [bacterium]|nr:hypothetical protein [bacterium]
MVSKNTKKAPKRMTKKSTKSASKKGAFGGYSICFKGSEHTLENVFGTTPIAPSLMTKKLWAYVKKYNLSNK